MELYSIRHRGLRRLIEENDARALRGDMVGRIRRVIAALVLAPDVESILGPPGWRIHALTGDRAGIWSISISGNWRITFSVRDGKIFDLNLEDYH
ncbi:MAG TPA: plasmid maintenance system killer [Alphaproteobacteria bacterium]|jgi:proteic killer suppression protein|nr:plasmid maintenance system killer [Alphaproteobacteria bacterium]HAM48012.1 plasmid maintenance system killer [Alphaproteobacteria bacterium]HBC52737.1 plasmid maintenance system killer [Alphaproteobacteria bacterium]HBF96971.1 plasmid maintenance system killer [Alphaproteobacteria bacterium]HCO91646.1 plasmid maintenance system killer [Alphaproteobacteria bacterium]